MRYLHYVCEMNAYVCLPICPQVSTGESLEMVPDEIWYRDFAI
jgi:hypothetical protein